MIYNLIKLFVLLFVLCAIFCSCKVQTHVQRTYTKKKYGCLVTERRNAHFEYIPYGCDCDTLKKYFATQKN